MLQANFKEEDINIIHRERLAGIARDIISESSEGYDALVLGRRGSSKMEGLFHRMVPQLPTAKLLS